VHAPPQMQHVFSSGGSKLRDSFTTEVIIQAQRRSERLTFLGFIGDTCGDPIMSSSVAERRLVLSWAKFMVLVVGS
jgi:hypothetical protein